MLRSVAFVGALVFAAGLLLSGCKAGGDPKACEEYATKVCAAAGEGATCQAVKQTVELLSPAACSAALSDVEATLAKLKDKRAVCDQLVTKLCADLGAETESCNLVKAKTPEFPPERCAQMMERYADVLADLKRREQANKPLDAEKQALIAAGEAPSFGPKDAKVTLVEFSDFQCPYCARAASAASELKKQYGTKVRFIFRQFPLNFHQDAHLAAQASLAADAQGKFWQFHDLAFANQKALDRASLEKHAKTLGLDVARFLSELDKGIYKERVDADFKLGEQVFVGGTPTLFLNGKRVENPTDVKLIGSLIDKEIGAVAKAD